MSNLSKTKGFSLVEVIIVLLIISILVVLSLPKLTTALRLNRVQTGSALVSGKLAEAKMLAIKQNRQVSFVMSETNNSIWVEANSAVIGTVLQLPQDTKIKISPNTSQTIERITFNSLSSLVTLPATVSTFNSLERVEKPVSVNITGRVAVGAMSKY